MPDLLAVIPSYRELQMTVTLMFCLLLIACLLALDKDGLPKRGPKAMPVEFCKLHSRPLPECLPQHGDDDPSVQHEPTTLE